MFAARAPPLHATVGAEATTTMNTIRRELLTLASAVALALIAAACHGATGTRQLGEQCTSAADCAGGLCLQASKSGYPACSRACASDSDCGAGAGVGAGDFSCGVGPGGE